MSAIKLLPATTPEQIEQARSLFKEYAAELAQFVKDEKEWLSAFGKSKSKIKAAGEAIDKTIKAMPNGVLLGVWALRYKGGTFSGRL
ncbi:MAG: hypothetical protein HY300_06215, partial [Verrucomicrobia bacterium]|nr:hypothetical protein [Verrucomicrobiota bacterium]